jgi:hypothetical protein
MGVTGMAKSHLCQPFHHKMAKLVQSRNFKTSKRHSSTKSKRPHGDFCMGSGFTSQGHLVFGTYENVEHDIS